MRLLLNYVLLQCCVSASIAADLDDHQTLLQRQYTAYLQADRLIKIYNVVEGYTSSLNVRLGDKVKQGDLLFNSEDKYRQLNLRKAKVRLKQQRYQYQQTQRLQAKQAVSDAQRQTDETALALAQIELDTLVLQEQDSHVHAPITGLISWQQIEVGDWLAPHQHVLSVFNQDDLRLLATVDNQLLSLLTLKQPVYLINIATPVPKAWIEQVYPEINSKTQQGQVKIKLEFVPKNWHSGQAITVQFGSAPN